MGEQNDDGCDARPIVATSSRASSSRFPERSRRRQSAVERKCKHRRAVAINPGETWQHDASRGHASRADVIDERKFYRHAIFGLPSPERQSRSNAVREAFASHRDNAPVAQLDRASDYESEGQRFESFRARHLPSAKRPPIATPAASSPASASGQFTTPNSRVLASRVWSAERSASLKASAGRRRQSSWVGGASVQRPADPRSRSQR